MLERENKTGLREKYPTASLIIPVILHDGDRIPETISLLHSFDAKRYAKTQLSSKAGLETLMNTIACRVAMHHKSCPAFDPQWQEITGDSYLDLLKPKTDELTYPSLGKAGS